MSNLKGSNLSVGSLVSLNISVTGQVNTVVVGAVSGIQQWGVNTLAVQIHGVGNWIVLDDKVEVQAV